MSEPSSCAIEDDSPVRRDEGLEVRRATSQRPSEPTYAMPSVEHLRGEREGAVDRADVAELLQGQQQPARGRPGQAGRGRPPRSATWCGGPRRSSASTSSPRARASTKSGPDRRVLPRRRANCPTEPRARLAEDACRGPRGSSRTCSRCTGRGCRGPRRFGQVGVHPCSPGLLAQRRAQVVDRGLDTAACGGQVDADQLVSRTSPPGRRRARCARRRAGPGTRRGRRG